MLTATYDEDLGIVCTTADGLATAREFDTYLPITTELLGRSRARHGRSLHLVDAAANPVQARDTFDHMAISSARHVREDDRCAVVLHSALARMQIGRMTGSFTRQFFTDRAAAIGWLLAEAGAAAA
jgi:hypothetical protein